MNWLTNKLLSRREGRAPAAPADNPHAAQPSGYPAGMAWEPDLIPPPELMRTERVEIMEEWFQWGQEWSVVLRVYGGMTRRSDVLEIGCGLGRIAYALRPMLSPNGSYRGFDIVRNKIEFLQQRFTPAHPSFRFDWADVHNTTYNPTGVTPGAEFDFPYADNSFDVVYAASVFTHLLPAASARYMRESARVLRRGGRCVFSLFLLDFYRPDQPRPWTFSLKYFDFDHAYDRYALRDFAVAAPDDPENTTACGQNFLERMAADAGLRLAQPVVPGAWSGAEHWVGAQDLLILEHAT